MSSETVDVVLFASYREAVGQSRIQIEVLPGTTVEDVYKEVQQHHPSLAELRPFTTFAVNREVVPADTAVRAGDEIAFLQPVSGGAR